MGGDRLCLLQDGERVVLPWVTDTEGISRRGTTGVKRGGDEMPSLMEGRLRRLNGKEHLHKKILAESLAQ
jgi:hypothetical protein